MQYLKEKNPWLSVCSYLSHEAQKVPGQMCTWESTRRKRALPLQNVTLASVQAQFSF